MSEEVRPPLYALLISPDREPRKAILEERKLITIREGWRDYRVGRPVMICCQIEPWCVTADIVEVRHCTLREVTPEELEADGFLDHDDMLEGMRRFYPNLDWNSPVTVIRWANVRGKLVDQWKEHLKFSWVLQG